MGIALQVFCLKFVPNGIDYWLYMSIFLLLQMMAKFAEDDRIEQMNAQKRRMKQLEHKRAVEDLIEDRRSQFAADREQELAGRREEERMEAFRKQIIEEERQKLLSEHAMRLLGYLPKVSGFRIYKKLLLVWKYIFFFTYCKIPYIFTAPTQFFTIHGLRAGVCMDFTCYFNCWR